VVLVLLKVGERDLEDAALESIVGVLETSGAVYEGLSDAVDYMSTNFQVACDRPTYFVTWKVDGALRLYQSLRWKGSVLFFRPFLPLDNLLFFPTAMLGCR